MHIESSKPPSKLGGIFVSLAAAVIVAVGSLSTIVWPSTAQAYTPDFTLSAFDAGSGNFTIDASSLPSNPAYACQFVDLKNMTTHIIYSLNVTNCMTADVQPTTVFSPFGVPDGLYTLVFGNSSNPVGPIISQAFNVVSNVMTSSAATPITPFTLTAFSASSGTFTIDASSLPDNSDYACQVVKLKDTTTGIAYGLNVENCLEAYAQPTTLFTPTTIPDGTYELIFGLGGPVTPAPVVSQAFALEDGEMVPTPPQTVILDASADTYVRNALTNRNLGAGQFMRVQSSGNNRALVRFDQTTLESAIGSGSVLSAKLRLTITDNGNNWGPAGRTVDAHRLLVDWTEGNGTEDDRGTGAGATWSCASDSNIANLTKNCTGLAEWEMGQPNNPSAHPWAQAPSDTQLIVNGQTGVVEYDVTSDVVDFLDGAAGNYGWLIRKTAEGLNGSVSFGAKESALGAELVITYQP